MKIKVEIYTPGDSRSFEADAVFLPGTEGAFEVLPGHADIISALAAGDVRWRSGATEEKMTVKGGIVRVERNLMQICAQI